MEEIAKGTLQSSVEYNYLTNRFHFAVHLFSNRSQMMSKCVKNKKWHMRRKPSVSLLFLPHFNILCDLLLNRRTVTCNLVVLCNKEKDYYSYSIIIILKSSNITAPTVANTKKAM